MSFVCGFCEHAFSTKCNLINHQRSAKYCLQLRKEQAVEKYKCKSCNKVFTQQNNLDRHSEKCVGRMLHLIEEQRDEIFRLQTQVATLQKEIEGYKLQLAEDKGKIIVYKERPGAVYVNPKILNVKCDTIPPLTIETVKQEVESGNYSYEMYIRGERGLVDFIESLIKSEDEQRSYVCTDAARNKFHRLIETREWKEDNGANFLNKIFDQLKVPATEYYQKINSMTLESEERDTGDFLMDKTKKMFFGITSPKSRDRLDLFNRIRMEVRKLAAV